MRLNVYHSVFPKGILLPECLILGCLKVLEYISFDFRVIVTNSIPVRHPSFLDIQNLTQIKKVTLIFTENKLIFYAEALLNKNWKYSNGYFSQLREISYFYCIKHHLRKNNGKNIINIHIKQPKEKT